MKVLAFDPSGNHAEGNGTTGWALFLDGDLMDFGEVKAADYSEAEAYWFAIMKLVQEKSPNVVVYETYRLRAGKAMEQSWSLLETPQLIGCLRLLCYRSKILCVGQNPSLKERFNDSVLVNIGVAEKRSGGIHVKGRRTNMHMRDAVRHGMWFNRYGRKKMGVE